MADHRPPLHRRAAGFGISVPAALTLIVIATVAFDIRFAPFSISGVNVPILLFEVPLAALSLVTVHDLIRRRSKPKRSIQYLIALLAILLVISATAHPSWFAAIRLYRLAAATALSYWIVVELRGPGRVRVYAVAIAAALFQAYLATGQHFLGKGMGYGFLGEGEYLYGGEGPPRYVHGTFPLHHILAAFSMATMALLLTAVARRLENLRRWWFVGLVVTAVPIGFAYSRMGAVAWLWVVTVLGIASITSRHLYLAAWVAVLVGGFLSAAVGAEGWRTRTTETIQGDGPGGDDEGADVGGRIRLATEALRVIERQPVLGTGIGRYLSVAREQQGEQVELIAHNVPLLVAAENGLVAGAVLILLLVVAGAATVRAGPLSIAVFGAYLPFILLDHFPYEDTQGIALTAIWAAATAASIHRTAR